MRSFLSVLVLIAAIAVTVWVTISQLPGEASAARAIPAARAQQIQSVAIDGRDLPLAALRSVLHTEAGGFIDDASLTADRRALEEVLVERGYLDAVVSAPTVTFDAAGAYVVFTIEQGVQFHLRTVAVVGADPRAAHVVTLAGGDIANPSRLERARQTLAESYPAGGVELVTHEDAALATVDVELIIRQ